MFPSLAARETYVAETNFAARKQENVFALSQKHICFSDTNFASATYVSQFSHPRKHDLQQFFRTMFPSLARALKQKHFLVSEQQNLFPQHMFPARLNWETFVSATMFPQQCFLV